MKKKKNAELDVDSIGEQKSLTYAEKKELKDYFFNQKQQKKLNLDKVKS